MGRNLKNLGKKTLSMYTFPHSGIFFGGSGAVFFPICPKKLFYSPPPGGGESGRNIEQWIFFFDFFDFLPTFSIFSIFYRFFRFFRIFTNFFDFYRFFQFQPRWTRFFRVIDPSCPSVRPSVCNKKYSYFPSLLFSETLHEVRPSKM